MRAADLPAVLAIQAQCYGDALVESANALESRLTLSPATCWVAALATPSHHGHSSPSLAAYLFTHAWPEASLPPWNGQLVCDWPDTEPLTWFIHDMAVAPIGRGAGLASRLHDAARDVALNDGLRSSRLIAVQAADGYWRRLGYAPLAAGTHAAKLAAYGEAAVLMGCELVGNDCRTSP